MQENRVYSNGCIEIREDDMRHPELLRQMPHYYWSHCKHVEAAGGYTPELRKTYKEFCSIAREICQTDELVCLVPNKDSSEVRKVLFVFFPAKHSDYEGKHFKLKVDEEKKAKGETYLYFDANECVNVEVEGEA